MTIQATSETECRVHRHRGRSDRGWQPGLQAPAKARRLMVVFTDIWEGQRLTVRFTDTGERQRLRAGFTVRYPGMVIGRYAVSSGQCGIFKLVEY